MGDEDDGQAAVGEGADERFDATLRRRVQRRGRLVEEQGLGLACQGPGQAEALGFADLQHVCPPLDERCGQADPLEQPGRIGGRLGHGQVLGDGARKGHRHLADVLHAAP